MPKVIDAIDYIKNKKKLPTEAFFVDTNIIIEFADPFSTATLNKFAEENNEKINEVLHYFKSLDGTHSYSTVVNCLEYYKHIQVNYYQTRTDKKYNSFDFKKTLEIDSTFFDGWQKHLSVFSKLFKKNFPVFETTIDQKSLLDGFDSSAVDFGDFAEYKIITSLEPKFKCIFSNDKDFYSLPNDFYLVTIQPKIISHAREADLLYN